MSAETILLLEDDLLTRKGLTGRLVEAGYQVIAASTTIEAINVLRTSKVDLMILDLTLLAEDPFNGVSDGFTFKEWVQSMFPDFDLPVIVHTADDSPSLEWRAQSHGISEVVRKGAGVQELLDAIRRALTQRHSRSDPGVTST